MNTTDTDRDKVVIPDTDGARSKAERFGKFLALGASQSSGAGAADALARDVEAYRIEQSSRDRSTAPGISDQVGSRGGDTETEPELGVDCVQNVSEAGSGSIPVDATVEPPAGDLRNEEGDQLCMSY